MGCPVKMPALLWAAAVLLGKFPRAYTVGTHDGAVDWAGAGNCKAVLPTPTKGVYLHSKLHTLPGAHDRSQCAAICKGAGGCVGFT